MGEIPENLANGTDAALMRYITSANIACGGHAGDEETVRETLRLAKSFDVAVGAHPGYPDRENFGRVDMQIQADALEQSLLEQLRWFLRLARDAGVSAGHVKPHGALYHATSRRREVAQLIARVVRAASPGAIVVAQAGSPALGWFREMGLAAAGEAFADRAYEPDGRLRDRRRPGALLDADSAALQAIAIVAEGRVKTGGGNSLPVQAETLCIHSDTPGAPHIAQQIRSALAQRGIPIEPLAPPTPS
jgi:UPF0271 protein